MTSEKKYKVKQKREGRPEAVIDWKKVDDLLISGCMGTEVAAYFGIHPNTFYRRAEEHHNMSFSEIVQQKRAKGDSILRSHQYAKALGLTDKGDNTLLIWLGKNRLNQKETPNEVSIDDKTVKSFTNLMELISGAQKKSGQT